MLLWPLALKGTHPRTGSLLGAVCSRVLWLPGLEEDAFCGGAPAGRGWLQSNQSCLGCFAPPCSSSQTRSRMRADIRSGLFSKLLRV